MLANSIFSIFKEENKKNLCSFLNNPDKEFRLEKDSYCRQGKEGLLDKSYKCSFCHQLVKIARTFPSFKVESGEKEGSTYLLIESSNLPLFSLEKFIFYDTFRGSYLISLLLESIGLPTLNYITCAYSCQKNHYLIEKFTPLSEFTLDDAKQLLITLRLLEEFRFVLDEVEFSSNQSKVTLEFKGLKVTSKSLLKIEPWKGASLSFNSLRLISSERRRKERLLKKERKERNEEWFRPYSRWGDLKHLGDTRFNVYICFLTLYPYLNLETKELWKELWKGEEYEEVEKMAEKRDLKLEYFSLREKGVEHLYQLVK